MVEANEVIDTSGLNCPLPVLKAKKAIKSIDVGSVLKIIATDPGSKKDIPAWARVTGQELLEETEEGGKFVFYVKRTK
ncbi:MAG: sulfurtransferase TusA family protein [Methanobacteriota archaeon]|nr:MAG: sulfurtransferase TusA family protein [Euryarchaeota archaeon]